MTATEGTAAPTEPKLHHVDINSFRGEITKWIEFWQYFESTIHNNTNLSATDHFHYLLRYLGGVAASAIANSVTTETSH